MNRSSTARYSTLKVTVEYLPHPIDIDNWNQISESGHPETLLRSVSLGIGCQRSAMLMLLIGATSDFGGATKSPVRALFDLVDSCSRASVAYRTRNNTLLP